MLQVKFMRRALFSSVIAVLLSAAIQAQTPTAVETISVSEIRTGMHGVAYTVFQGTKPESMGVEVLGILKNANGPGVEEAVPDLVQEDGDGADFPSRLQQIAASYEGYHAVDPV